jgi:hypothetical protein
MNNKTVALFLSLGMTVGLAACGSDDGGEGGENGENGVIPNPNRISLVQPEPLSSDDKGAKG